MGVHVFEFGTLVRVGIAESDHLVLLSASGVIVNGDGGRIDRSQSGQERYCLRHMSVGKRGGGNEEYLRGC